jgi:hypothetical protein
VVVVVG